MERSIVRKFSFSDREIREALIAALKAKGLPAPIYVGDTPDTTWIKEPGGVTVTWTEQDEMNL